MSSAKISAAFSTQDSSSRPEFCNANNTLELHNFTAFGFDITFTWVVTECHLTDVRLRKGHAEAQLVETLSYKREGRGFDY
jgi:hypothetical protein